MKLASVDVMQAENIRWETQMNTLKQLPRKCVGSTSPNNKLPTKVLRVMLEQLHTLCRKSRIQLFPSFSFDLLTHTCSL